VNSTEQREILAAACKALAFCGHDDFQLGHVSVRESATTYWLKPKGIDLGEATAATMLLVDLDGNVLEGSGDRPHEYFIHGEILRAHPEVHAVVHSHALACIAMSCLTEPLRPYSHHALPFVLPPIPTFRETTNLITTRPLGQAVARELGPANGLFLQNHGMVTIGADLRWATVYAAMLERACALQIQVSSQGSGSVWTSDEELLARRDYAFTEASVQQIWEYLERKGRVAFGAPHAPVPGLPG